MKLWPARYQQLSFWGSAWLELLSISISGTVRIDKAGAREGDEGETRTNGEGVPEQENPWRWHGNIFPVGDIRTHAPVLQEYKSGSTSMLLSSCKMMLAILGM